MPVLNFTQDGKVVIPLPVPIENGGTGAEDAATAIANLGIENAINNATGRFGNLLPHNQFNDCNLTKDIRGWTFVVGASNTPNNSGHLYKLGVGLGSEHPTNYSLELGISRYGEKRLYCRKQENGIFDSWEQLKIGSQSISSNSRLTFLSKGNIARAVFDSGINIEPSSSNDAAYISFHRPGYYYINFGLDTDNQLKVGNFAANGNIAYRVWNESNGIPVWQTPSDRNLKNSIKPIESALDLILQVNPVKFRYTASIRRQNLFGSLEERCKPHYGFIAQDFPIDELVTEKADGEKGINYLEIIPFLVGAIQELQKQIDDLKKVTN